MQGSVLQTSIVRLAGLCVVLLTLAPLAVTAQTNDETRRQSIEWRAVAGGRGYRIQIRNAGGETLKDEDVNESRVTLELTPGTYQIRIAALNVFGQPGRFSQWYDFRVRTRAEEAAAAQNPPTTGAGGLVVRSADAVDSSAAEWRPRVFLPGVMQIERGQTWRGAAWIASLLTVSGYGYSQKLAGDGFANDASGQLPLAFVSAINGQPLLSVWLLQERSQLRANYDAAQNRQRAAGGLFALLYALQVFDAVYLSPPGSDRTVILESSFTADSRAGGSGALLGGRADLRGEVRIQFSFQDGLL
jgi:hypothetical protein